jgi:hypothetical protein
MQPLYLATIEGLGRSDFVKVDRAACLPEASGSVLGPRGSRSRSGDRAPEVPAESFYARAVTRQPKIMRRQHPRSLPRARATKARSAPNMAPWSADHRGQSSQILRPTVSNRLRSTRCAIGFCYPPASPYLVCTNPLTQFLCPSVPRLTVSKKGLGRLLSYLTTARPAVDPAGRAAASPPCRGAATQLSL